MKKYLFILAFLMGAVFAAAPDGMRIDNNGTFSIGEVRFFLWHFNPSWAGHQQDQLIVDSGFPRRTRSEFVTSGVLPMEKFRYRLNEKISFTEKDAFRVESSLAGSEPVPTAALFFSADLPAGRTDIRLTIDGREMELPAEFDQMTLLTQPAKKVLISTPERQIEISGDFAVTLQDNRQFQENSFSVRMANPETPPQVKDWAFSCLVRVLPPLAGERFPAGVTIDPVKGIKIGKAEFRWTFFDENWGISARGMENFRLDAENSFTGINRFVTVGDWRVEKRQRMLRFREEIAAGASSTFRYSASLQADPAVKTNCLTFMMQLPAGQVDRAEVDGQKVEIPKTFKEMALFSSSDVKSFRFESEGHSVTVRGNFGLLIQDDRQWNEYIQFRILPADSFGTVSSASLNLEFQLETQALLPLDLSPVANMGFRDDVADDGKGGWTDQGPNNDLRMLKSGKVSFDGIDFAISGKDKSCIVVAGQLSQRRGIPGSATLAVKGTGDFRYLYLLHASAWTPSAGTRLGSIVAEYAGGKKREIPVVAGKDCGNWWEPIPFPNAAVIWIGENPQSYVGLYLSQFDLGETPASIRFVPEKQAVWMIVGAVLGGRVLDLKQAQKTVYFVAGDKWGALEFDGKVQAGSPLDFSRYTDKPAGKYGPVTVNSKGYFSFRDAPEKRVRFFGPNLVGTANYLSKETADDFVDKAVRMGYNTVRFHHFENDLLDRNAADTLTFDPGALDRLNYLFAELKKQGIYLTIDLYASRWLKEGDNIEELKGIPYSGRFELKSLIPVSPSAMANWKEFARRLLSVKNPYTGLTWGEDPALYSLNLVNEAPVIQLWDQSPEFIPLYEKKFVEYLQKRKMDTAENRARRDGLFAEFLNELQRETINEQIRFLREELKVKLLITDLNAFNQYTLAPIRSTLDFVDNHVYWDHPNFPEQQWRLPHLYNQSSSIWRLAQNPREIMASRVFGKPFTVTEINFCNPNIHRVEAAPLIGGYAGLQDWDGIYRFAWSHDRNAMEKQTVPQGFDIVNDPQAQLAERIIFMLFLRGDVTKAAPAYAFHAKPETFVSLPELPGRQALYPQEFDNLGLFARIGTLSGKEEFAGVKKLDVLRKNWRSGLPANVRKALTELEGNGNIISATGQIELNARALAMSVITPRSEVMTFADERSGKVMKLKNADVYQTVALLSLDDKALTESRELLLIQLTNLAGNKQKFLNERITLLQSFGELPLLLERGKADVELALPAGFKVEALKLDGSSNGVIQTEYRNGKLIFTANTMAKPGGVMVYHLTR